jgi:magnesium chelatase family protein
MALGILDGGVRAVRGALPIAIEARGRKISRLVVPELNAKEAAMVGGMEIYPLKSLLDVIRFVNTGNGILPLKSGQRKPAQRSPAISRGLQGRAWPALGQARAGGCRRRTSQHLDDRPSRLGQNHAGQAHAHDPAPFTFEEALETTKIHSVVGVLDASGPDIAINLGFSKSPSCGPV